MTLTFDLSTSKFYHHLRVSENISTKFENYVTFLSFHSSLRIMYVTNGQKVLLLLLLLLLFFLLYYYYCNELSLGLRYSH